MAKKVKIIGYAKREFYDNGIEYRNFSDDLTGNQLTSEGGTTLFTLGNFKVTTNLDPKLTKNYRTSLFSRYYTLDSLILDDDILRISGKENKTVSLNLDKTDLSNYAYFGSMKEFIRVSLENIITLWPASLFVTSTNILTAGNTNPTFEVRTYDAVNNITEFKVNVGSIRNKFGINLKKSGTIQNTFNEGNPLRDMNLSSNYYVVAVGEEEYPIIDFIGQGTDSYITIKVQGNVFADGIQVDYHIKPSEQKRNVFFQSLNDFEAHLLDRKTDFKANFRFNYENDNGVTILGKKTLKWPVSDGYNIDFESEYYVDYVKKLLEIAEKSDKSRSNLINNMLISESIIEFDTLDKKMSKTLNIYGRNFDELKRHSSGIKFAHTVTYDKKNNVPDGLVKNLARTMGWELTTSLFNIDLGEDLLTTDGELYLSPVESEIEFWRRLVMNTPWLWKSKGTRKSVEFLLRFFGTPLGLINVNEHVYVGTTLVDVVVVEEIYGLMGLNFNRNQIPVDEEGYPKILRDNGEMYFQKGGHWYRQTGGENSTIDLLNGNNPHIGPYDGGLEYIKQFNPVVPGFEPFIVETPRSETTIQQGFLNYDYGKFDQFYEGNVRAEMPTNIPFSDIYVTELAKCTEYSDGCDLTSRWNLEAYLDGTLISNNEFFSSFDGQLPTSIDYLAALESVKTQLSVSSVEQDGIIYLVEALEDCTAGSQLTGKHLEFRMKLTFEYDCLSGTFCGDNVVIGEEADGLILFENNTTNTVPSKECCQELGFTSRLVAGGFNCYNDIEGLTSNTDVYTFICAASVTPEDALTAKNQITNWYNEYRATNSDFMGNLYFIPLIDEKWLDYPNKVVSGTATIHTGTGWSGIASLPPDFNTVYWNPPNEVMVIALIDESNSLYHTTTPTLTGQPTSHFVNNYKTFAGNLKSHYQFFKGIIYPIIKDTSGETAAFIKHTLAAIEGTILTADEINDLESPVILTDLQSTNPYENYIIPGSSPEAYLRPLKEFNWSSIYEKQGPAATAYGSPQFIKDLNKLMIINQDDNIYTVDSTNIDTSETDIVI